MSKNAAAQRNTNPSGGSAGGSAGSSAGSASSAATSACDRMRETCKQFGALIHEERKKFPHKSETSSQEEVADFRTFKKLFKKWVELRSQVESEKRRWTIMQLKKNKNQPPSPNTTAEVQKYVPKKEIISAVAKLKADVSSKNPPANTLQGNFKKWLLAQVIELEQLCERFTKKKGTSPAPNGSRSSASSSQSSSTTPTSFSQSQSGSASTSRSQTPSSGASTSTAPTSTTTSSGSRK